VWDDIEYDGSEDSSVYDDMSALKQALSSSSGGVHLQSNSLSSSEGGILIDPENDRNSQVNSDSWHTVTNKSWNKKASGASSSPFDPNRYGKPLSSRSPSSVTGSSRSFGSGRAERSSQATSRGGWAKIKAYVRYSVHIF
jgi:hypothetical protein